MLFGAAARKGQKYQVGGAITFMRFSIQRIAQFIYNEAFSVHVE
jgi:hypothetical protein